MISSNPDTTYLCKLVLWNAVARQFSICGAHFQFRCSRWISHKSVSILHDKFIHARDCSMSTASHVVEFNWFCHLFLPVYFHLLNFHLTILLRYTAGLRPPSE